MRYLAWFSCGAASAVAAKTAIDKYGEQVEVIYCDTMSSEHPDNIRFFVEVESWLARKIIVLKSSKYFNIEDVFHKTRYMSGIAGARCTVEMKKVPRENYQRSDDVHIFGYTFDEVKRAERFEQQNPSLYVDWILIDNKITKADCLRIVGEAGIALPAMYGLGFKNNNCLGCVKATSPKYWNEIRRHFPESFKVRAEQSRELGARLVRVKGKRVFLDELPLEDDSDNYEDLSCGPVCQVPQDDTPIDE